MAISLELLTDDDILDYSRSDGKDHVLYSHGDLNLKFDRLQPITGGVYDTEIFGSPMVDRCVCGKFDKLLRIHNLALIAVLRFILEMPP